MKLFETEKLKMVRSSNYNYNFDKITGEFQRWGKTFEDDPQFAPSPEIADFEVTTKCSHGCRFCYKSNTEFGHNMTFKTFKKIFDKLPKTITQIAFGADATATANPELIKIMKYSRKNGIIPNITVAKLSDKTATALAEVCGAVAVSRYENKLDCYNTIKNLNAAGLKQVNIHLLVSEQTIDWIYETFNDYLNGNIPGLNAIVLLGLKKKGRGTGYNILSQEEYSKVINFALDNNIPIGSDSCSGPKLVNSIINHKDFHKIYKSIDPCESTCFSLYIDEKGKFYPCSFMPKTEGWEDGIDMNSISDFSKDVWYNEKTVKFRNSLVNNKDCNGCRNCPVFEI